MRHAVIRFAVGVAGYVTPGILVGAGLLSQTRIGALLFTSQTFPVRVQMPGYILAVLSGVLLLAVRVLAHQRRGVRVGVPAIATLTWLILAGAAAVRSTDATVWVGVFPVPLYRVERAAETSTCPTKPIPGFFYLYDGRACVLAYGGGSAATLRRSIEQSLATTSVDP